MYVCVYIYIYISMYVYIYIYIYIYTYSMWAFGVSDPSVARAKRLAFLGVRSAGTVGSLRTQHVKTHVLHFDKLCI